MSDEAVKVSIRGIRHLLNPERSPSSFNKVLWTRIGSEAVIEIGFYDLPEMRDALQAAIDTPGKIVDVTVNVTDRFSISPGNLLDIIRAAGSLGRDFVREELLPPEAIDAAWRGDDESTSI